jgi:hypothetical protein
MESNCLAVSFYVEIYVSVVVIGYGFSLLCPCSCFEVLLLLFFLLELQQCSSERGMLNKVPFWLFSPLREGTGVPAV